MHPSRRFFYVDGLPTSSKEIMSRELRGKGLGVSFDLV